MVLFVFSSVFSAAFLEVLLLLPFLLMARNLAIIPRSLASDDVSVTPAAARLAARNAAKPVAPLPSLLSTATTVRRAALDRAAAATVTASAKKRKAVKAAVAIATSPPTPGPVVTPILVESPAPTRGAGFSPGAVGRSVAAAIAPLLLEQLTKKVKLKAAPGDLAAPKWLGELEVVSQPDKLTLFEAARVRYVATCELTEHVPTP